MTLLCSRQCRKTETTLYFKWGDFSYHEVVAYKIIGKVGGAGSQWSYHKTQKCPARQEGGEGRRSGRDREIGNHLSN